MRRMVRLSHALIITAITAGFMFAASAPAAALERETTDRIPVVTLEVPASHRIDEDIDTAFVGAGGCERLVADQLKVTATFEPLFNPSTADGKELLEEIDYFFVERGSTARIDCASGELCTVIEEEDVTISEDSIRVSLGFRELTGFASPDECTGFEAEYFFRVTVRESLSSDRLENADAKILVDTVRPEPPTGVTSRATENTIEIGEDFVPSPSEDVDGHVVFFSSTPFEAGANPEDLDIRSKPLSADNKVTVNLDPDQTVYIALAARDLTGNFSPLSEVTQTTALQTNDFWEEYKQAGGSEAGGCSSVGNSASYGQFALFALLLLGLCFIRRRNVTLSLAALAALVFVMGTPNTAAADTPIYGNFELRLGGYYPAVDDEFGGSGPFGDTFGSGNLLLGELEVDMYLYQHIGKAGIHLNAGYSSVKGNARAASEQDQDQISDTTRFVVIPFRAGLVYRYDYSAINHGIPLVPVLKGGLDMYRWRVADANRETAVADGETGAGWKPGYHVAVGLHLLLDFIDPATAAVFDLSWGVNNSYLFGEFMHTKIDGFGGDGLDLSDNIWMFGLSFEF